MESQWICCQLGAREHYAVPLALKMQGALYRLITEVWVPQSGIAGRIPAESWRQRYHPQLLSDAVIAWNMRALAFELKSRVLRRRGWQLILERNAWFQRGVVDSLVPLADWKRMRHPTLFSYSYTALEPFRWAKKHGISTVLGQIDGGQAEEQLVLRLGRDATSGDHSEPSNAAPYSYWEQWREECELADKIIVNSRWSYELLSSAGISESKLGVLPLAYTPPAEAAGYTRSYPSRFTCERPLRVLFLGQVIRRKGAIELLEALRHLAGEPIELWFVGPVLLDVPPEFREHLHVRWVGAVPRSATADWYRNADVFIFPTHSDGFGLTQLEAQAWKLPIIASRFCGDVVKSGINGMQLGEVTPVAIADALRECLRDPRFLASWSANSRSLEDFGIAALSQHLLELAEQI